MRVVDFESKSENVCQSSTKRYLVFTLPRVDDVLIMFHLLVRQIDSLAEVLLRYAAAFQPLPHLKLNRHRMLV